LFFLWGIFGFLVVVCKIVFRNAESKNATKSLRGLFMGFWFGCSAVIIIIIILIFASRN
jgi:hypothetical protein